MLVEGQLLDFCYLSNINYLIVILIEILTNLQKIEENDLGNNVKIFLVLS